ncbi:MAG: hypothetical protein IKS17_01630 [Firmicutes bacterium]|nr:hypothetical protein [Bacillota bacterium]
MRRYIALTAVVLAFTGCGKTEQVEQPTQTEPTQVQTEITTEDVPVQVKPDVADIRTYCVSLDAARNAILADYKDKIPEKLRTTFDANSDVLNEYMQKAAGDLTQEETEKIFGELKKLEVFFCDTMAKEVGAGKKIEEISKAATHGADYYFEKIVEEESEQTTQEESTEISSEDETGEDTDKKDKDSDKEDKDETTEETTEKEKK